MKAGQSQPAAIWDNADGATEKRKKDRRVSLATPIQRKASLFADGDRLGEVARLVNIKSATDG